MILATFNGLDLALLSLVVAGLFWLLMRAAHDLDEHEDRLDREFREERERKLRADELEELRGSPDFEDAA